jgi:flagellar hook capping protein FlgD
MAPDTNFVFQDAEGSNDGHRWQQFGVLPDRWKDGAWSAADRNAPAPACMLYVDWEDRRGDERLWVGIADSIGATAPARWGAHNGWHARGDQDITVAIATDPSIAVVKNGGQPGTIWDMFGVKASESSTTSSSLGSRTTTNPSGFQTGKKNLNGPSGLMLRQYYRILLILTGDLNSGNIGPYVDKGDNDVGLLADFAQGVAGTSKPRALWVMGRGFVEGQETGGASGHVGFVPAQFGAGLRSGDYRGSFGNTNDIVDLTPNAPINTNGNLYSVSNVCTITNDVLTLVNNGTFVPTMAAKYEDTNVSSNPKISSVYGPSTYPSTTDHESVTLVEGFRITSLGTWKTLTSQGRIDYYFNVITNLFSSLNCLLAPGQVIGVGDLPNNALVNFLALRSENPMRSGMAAISFGVTRKEHVDLKVYDVTGRLVKTLANREFDPAAGTPKGQFTIHWDGTNDDGQKVARGVYFYQLRTPSFVSQKKLAVLRR